MMKQLIQDFPKQLEIALDIANKAQLSPASKPIHNVVVSGMGGSGISGNLVTSFTYGDIKVPITVVKGYDIPAFIGENTLFVAGSFSGNTEETLNATEQALQKGAKIVAVSSGGAMGELAAKHQFDLVTIPGESKCPRASIGYAFVNILNIFHFHGLTSTAYAEEFRGAIKLLQAETESCQKLAQEITAALKDRMPILYADSLLEGLAIRCQQQLNENGKQLCHVNAFPEMNHNELVGWEFPQFLFPKATVIFLRSDYDHERSGIRMDVCKPIFEHQGAQTHQLRAKGANLIEQAMYLNHVFDWVSFFLAEANQTDPFPVEKIDYLKGELKKY